MQQELLVGRRGSRQCGYGLVHLDIAQMLVTLHAPEIAHNQWQPQQRARPSDTRAYDWNAIRVLYRECRQQPLHGHLELAAFRRIAQSAKDFDLAQITLAQRAEEM